jgi:hypothetical protein
MNTGKLAILETFTTLANARQVAQRLEAAGVPTYLSGAGTALASNDPTRARVTLEVAEEDLIDPEGREYQRRTVYRMNVGSARSPLLEAFDCPDPSVKTPQRGTTTTPLQALGLMNNSFVLRQSRRFAERVKREAGEEVAAQAERAYRLALARSPAAKEIEAATKLVREHGLDNLCWVLLNASEFLYMK